MEVERWLAPTIGAIAMSSAVGLVAVYAWGMSVPEHYAATVVAQVPGDPVTVFAALSDPERRPQWAPGVARIGQVSDDLLGRPVWRELDPTNDRFEFSVVSAEFPVWCTTTTKPEEIGVAATWTWTVAPAGTGTAVTLSEEGEISNPLFRGIWALRYGAYQQVEQDLAALSRHLGGDGVVARAGT
jgi:hypothetical protein